jgi:hypothetical protein
MTDVFYTWHQMRWVITLIIRSFQPYTHHQEFGLPHSQSRCGDDWVSGLCPDNAQSPDVVMTGFLDFVQCPEF